MPAMSVWRLARKSESSILNCVAATVVEVAQPIRQRIYSSSLMRLAHRYWQELPAARRINCWIEPGLNLWAQIKSVALLS